MVINFPSTWVILDLPICSLGPLHTALQNACSSNYLTQFTALHEFNPLADLHHYPSKTGAQQGFPVFTFHTPPSAKSPPSCSFCPKFSPFLTSAQGLPPFRLVPLRWVYALLMSMLQPAGFFPTLTKMISFFRAQSNFLMKNIFNLSS